jgi:hypothetical protein
MRRTLIMKSLALHLAMVFLSFIIGVSFTKLLLAQHKSSGLNKIEVVAQSQSSNQPQAVQSPVPSDNESGSSEDEEAWTPTEIEECIAKVNVGESFKFETSFNPFYLRANLDGNKFVDYAVLIKGQNTGKRGVVICKDSKQPFIFGELSKPETPLSSFDDDNFITSDWEIITKEETRTLVESPGKDRIATDAKGESIGFMFEGGGSVFIYWDGKTFRVVEGC